MNAHIQLMGGKALYREVEISQLDISVRLRNIFISMSFKTIGDVLDYMKQPRSLRWRNGAFVMVDVDNVRYYGIKNLLYIRNCGKKTIKEVRLAFIKVGVPKTLIDKT